MRLSITAREKKRILATLDEFSEHAEFRRRGDRNGKPMPRMISASTLWKSLVIALLTTQARSGGGSPINNLLISRDFSAFSYAKLKKGKFPKKRLEILLSRYRYSSRRGPIPFIQKARERFASFMDENRNDLYNLSVDIESRRLENERRVANAARATFSGIGLKQSRNFLQIAGLSRYVIPLDSRWANLMSDNDPLARALIRQVVQNEISYLHLENQLVQIVEPEGWFPYQLDAAVFLKGQK